jgi:hypothetical protein
VMQMLVAEFFHPCGNDASFAALAGERLVDE